MGLSSEGYRTRGQTVLPIRLVKVRDQEKPSIEEVEEAQRAIEAAGNRLPLFPVVWMRKGKFQLNTVEMLSSVPGGENGTFILKSHQATFTAAEKLGFEYILCDVEGGTEDLGEENIRVEREED